MGGNLLAGNGSTAGTDYTAMVARGTNLRYYTPSGDRVTFKITGGGIIDDWLSGSGQGVKLSVVNEVPHHTVLSGSSEEIAHRHRRGVSWLHLVGAWQVRRCPGPAALTYVPGY